MLIIGLMACTADSLHRESLKMIKEFKLVTTHWDCECKHNYIHPNSEDRCNECGAERESQPDSRENEVMEFKSKAKIYD